MKTLKLLIKTSFINKINDFLCFDIENIFNRRSNEVLISYIIKINTVNHMVQDRAIVQWRTNRESYMVCRSAPF